jgi:hypothetical protein
MRVIAIEQGFYRGTRLRVGTEFEMVLPASGVLPKWVVPANSEARAKLVSEGEAKRAHDLAAIIAAAGPKRDGKPGARPTNTGWADAAAETAPGKAVTPSWYKPSPVEKAVAGVEAAPAPAPAGDDALSDLA